MGVGDWAVASTIEGMRLTHDLNGTVVGPVLRPGDDGYDAEIGR
jgi:hypothetical protein